MKKLLLLFLFPILLLSQETSILVKKYSKDKKFGDCQIIKVNDKVKDSFAYRIFTVNVPKDGEYYLSAWVNSFYNSNKIENFSLYVDRNQLSVNNSKTLKTNWQAISFTTNTKGKDLKIKLVAGNHEIIFGCPIPNIPSVEFIVLSQYKERVALNSDAYNRYIEEMKTSKLPDNYDELKEKELRDEKLKQMGLLKVLQNPEGNYKHDINRTFGYSYYKEFYFSSGTSVTFETKKDDPNASDPVMQLFNKADPINKGTWTNDDGGQGHQAKISVTIQHSGYYYLYVRAYWMGTAGHGTSDLYKDGNLYASNIPFRNDGLRYDHNLNVELNYFTCWLGNQDDSRIWIEDQSGFPGLIVAHNDDYHGISDYNWKKASRVKQNIPKAIRAVQLSSYSSYNPNNQKCDLYFPCKNSTIMSYFPNLKADDAIMSAPASGMYNCISWSGGITSYWEWPPSAGSRYYVSGNSLASFDRFYSNNPTRYSGSENWNYTRNGANLSNNCIDLWALNGSYTHASVSARHDNIPSKLPANGQPHGYDWESKPGGLMRTFHPRHSLNGSSYGSVNKYYKNVNALNKMSSDFITSTESIERGLSVLEVLKFSENESKNITNLTKRIKPEDIEKFNIAYNTWKKTWESSELTGQSNPREYAKSEEYIDLLKFCIKSDKKILPLIVLKLYDGDIFTINLLEDLTYKGNEYLMEEVKKEISQKKYTKDNVFIIYTLRGNWFRYGKKLLSNFKNYKGFNKFIDPNRFGVKSFENKDDEAFANYPNPFNPTTKIEFNIISDSHVTMKIFDVLGREVITLINNEFMNAGLNSVTWSGKDLRGNELSSGIYFCHLTYNNQHKTLKLLLNR